jgi:two-component sensor histidine kinase
VEAVDRETMRQTLLHPDDIGPVREAAARAHRDQAPYDMVYRVWRDGDWRWMRVLGGPQVEGGRMVGMHGLVQDIHEQTLAQARLEAEVEERERVQQRQELLIHELNHRVKNILAMVQAIASQTLSGAASPQAAREALELRLLALARAHDVITRESWESAELHDVLTAALAPHEGAPEPRIAIEGPRLRLEPKTAVSMTLALHELTTNAVKYGALSVPHGRVQILWSAKPAPGGVELTLDWSEHGGPQVHPPERRGFGSRLIARSLMAEGGTADLTYASEGVRCRLAVTLPELTAADGAAPDQPGV